MRLELLYTPGCPNLQKVRILLRETLESLGLDLSTKEIEISGPVKAEEAAFPGSPTIRIDGRDLEPESARTVGSGCRIYKTGTGDTGRATPEIQNRPGRRTKNGPFHLHRQCGALPDGRGLGQSLS